MQQSEGSTVAELTSGQDCEVREDFGQVLDSRFRPAMAVRMEPCPRTVPEYRSVLTVKTRVRVNGACHLMLDLLKDNSDLIGQILVPTEVEVVIVPESALDPDLVSVRDVVRWASQFGLRRMTVDETLWTRIRYTDQPVGEKVIAVMEPIPVKLGQGWSLCTFEMSRDNESLRLDGVRGDPDNKEIAGRHFAFAYGP